MKTIKNSIGVVLALFAVGGSIAIGAENRAITPIEGCFVAHGLQTPLDPGWESPANPYEQQFQEIVPAVTIIDIQVPIAISEPDFQCPNPQQTVCCYEIEETTPGVFQIVRVYYKQD